MNFFTQPPSPPDPDPVATPSPLSALQCSPSIDNMQFFVLNARYFFSKVVFTDITTTPLRFSAFPRDFFFFFYVVETD